MQGGSDILEVGVPFTDPNAEGEAIAIAHQQALKNNISLADVFELVRKFRATDNDTPVILMGYNNPFFSFGYSNVAALCKEVGVDAILSVDSDYTELTVIKQTLAEYGVGTIVLVSPTTDDTRMQQLAQIANCFVYYVSLKGLTGSMAIDTAEVCAKVANVRNYFDIPIMVGFGIKTKEHIVQLKSSVDGIVIGSHYINLIANGNSNTLKSESNKFSEALGN